MATSGSIDWSVSRDDIIKASFQRIGVVASGGTPSTAQVTEASLILNGIVKSWAARLVAPFWKYGGMNILPQTDTSLIFVGNNNGNDHCTYSYSYTTTTAAALAVATTITVTSTTGISSGYYIGVELTDGDMHWTTVNGAPAGSTVTLTAGLPSDAASGALVYCYQTKADRVMRITFAEAFDRVNGTSIPLKIVTTDEYLALTNKNITGTYPLYLEYRARAGDTSVGYLRIWPRFNTGRYLVIANAIQNIQDFDALANTPDFPQEYFLPLVYELACALAPQYGIDINVQAWLRREADKLFSEIENNDYQEGSIYFRPDLPYGSY